MIHDHDIAALHTAKADTTAFIKQITIDMLVAQGIDADLPTLALGLLGLQFLVQTIESLGQGFFGFQTPTAIMRVIDKLIGCRARNAIQSEPQNKTAKSFPNNHNSHYARSKVEKVLSDTKTGGPTGPPAKR